MKKIAVGVVFTLLYGICLLAFLSLISHWKHLW